MPFFEHQMIKRQVYETKLQTQKRLTKTVEPVTGSVFDR